MAVALVVAYHLAPSAVPGGFLGVDVFFVLSGFLITSLLLQEVDTDGRIDLGAFYVRRARRLAPALLLLLAAGCMYASLLASLGELSRIREHSLWTLGYLANWHFIADGTTYTDLVAGQSPLRHTWSLAIEEQFYVVFPLLVLGLGRCVRWRFETLRRVLLGVAIVGTAASALWMAHLWGDGAEPSRGYFGTDTRAHSLLVGVALGTLLIGRPRAVGRGATVGAIAGTLGVGGLAAAVALSHETSAALQRGGFLLVALAVAGIISALERVGWLRSALSVRPLVALGIISYGVYLWHWPIIVLLDEGRTGLDGVPLGAARLALTLAAATASYLLVERPIRTGLLGRGLGRPALAVLPAAAVALVALIAVTTAAPARVAATAGPTTTIDTDALSSRVERPIGVLVVGDSVAHTLAGGTVGDFPSFEPWTPDQSPFDPAVVRLWSVAKPACSYLPGKVLGDGSGVAADLSGFCGDWQGDVDAALVAHPASVVVVALANDATARRVGDATIELGSADHRRLLSAFLDELRAIAQPRGADLVLLALPPRTGVSAQSVDEGGERERSMRELLQGYAAARPGVRVLDLLEQICPAGDCEHPRGGFDPAWRYDGMHYTQDGARWVAGWLSMQLATAGSPGS